MYISANDRVYVLGVFAGQHLTVMGCQGGKCDLACLNLPCVHGASTQGHQRTINDWLCLAKLGRAVP